MNNQPNTSVHPSLHPGERNTHVLEYSSTDRPPRRWARSYVFRCSAGSGSIRCDDTAIETRVVEENSVFENGCEFLFPGNMCSS